MSKPIVGLSLVAAGVLAGHYAYLHDIFLGEPTITMGPQSMMVAVGSLFAVAAGLAVLWTNRKDAS